MLFLFFCLLFMFGPRAYRGDDESVGVCFFGEGRRVAPVYMGAWGRSPHKKIVFTSPRSGAGASALKRDAGGVALPPDTTTKVDGTTCSPSAKIPIMLHYLRTHISHTSPLRLAYHAVRERVARMKYPDVSKKMTIIGITGTNGKTTTTNLVAAILARAGHKTAMASTVNFRIATQEWANESKFTTLRRGGAHRFLAQAHAAGCTHAVLEVSSHALMQHSVEGISFAACGLTYMSPEHIDFHGSWGEYVAAKVKLFHMLARDTARETIAVLPSEGDYVKEFRVRGIGRVVTTGEGGDVSASEVHMEGDMQVFTLHYQGNAVRIETGLLGGFNVSNILTASALCLELGVAPAYIQAAMREQAPVPGRLEPIVCGQDFRVIVDYAHTEDALALVCETFRPITAGKLWVVYGACGDRERTLRAPRGAVLDKLADEIVITTDDPYYEDPRQTMDDVLKGITRAVGAGLSVIEERREAITYALRNARKGDTVLICGMGAQTVQVWGREKRAWDDREVARDILMQR